MASVFARAGYLLLALGAAAFVLGAACGRGPVGDDQVTVHLELVPEAERPEFLLLSWFDDRGIRFENQRVPAAGQLPPEGRRLGTVMVVLDPAGGSERRVVVRGLRGQSVVCEAAARIPLPAEKAVTINLRSGRRSDTDGDGVPDEIDNCPGIFNPAQQPCLPASDGGVDTAGPHTDGSQPDTNPDRQPEGQPDTALQTDAAADVPSDSAPDMGASEVAGPPADSSPDGPAEGGLPTCVPEISWEADFDRDPTQLDLDQDGVKDWMIRGGGIFPAAELEGGLWRASGGKPLDTNPKNDFARRTLVFVRFQSTDVVRDGALGPLFWINLDGSAPRYAALLAGLKHEAAGGQTLTLFGIEAGQQKSLATFSGFPDRLIEIHLDIDPPARSVDLWVEGVYRGRYGIPNSGAPNGNAWATLYNEGGPAAYDHVRVQICRPP
jgi:hypothetical protein